MKRQVHGDTQAGSAAVSAGHDAETVPETGHSNPVVRPENRRRTRRTLLALFAVCVAPVIASYVAYYWLQPSGRTNYGALIQPLRDVARMPVRALHVPPPIPGERVLPISMNQPADLGRFAGRWVMVVIAPARCDVACEDRLYKIRQVRLTTGKNRNRVERLWLQPVSAGSLALSQPLTMPEPELLTRHPGLWVAAVERDQLRRQFSSIDGDPGTHIFLIDPLNKLMMRFPENADPNRMKKDLNKLLKASRIG